MLSDYAVKRCGILAAMGVSVAIGTLFLQWALTHTAHCRQL